MQVIWSEAYTVILGGNQDPRPETDCIKAQIKVWKAAVDAFFREKEERLLDRGNIGEFCGNVSESFMTYISLKMSLYCSFFASFLLVLILFDCWILINLVWFNLILFLHSGLDRQTLRWIHASVAMAVRMMTNVGVIMTSCTSTSTKTSRPITTDACNCCTIRQSPPLSPCW